MSGRTFTKTFFIAQLLGWAILALALLYAYAGLNARFDQEAKAQNAGIERLLKENRQLLMGLTDYIECIATQATRVDTPTPAPLRSCRAFLGGNP